jgi:hypothetical protein
MSEVLGEDPIVEGLFLSVVRDDHLGFNAI